MNERFRPSSVIAGLCDLDLIPTSCRASVCGTRAWPIKLPSSLTSLSPRPGAGSLQGCSELLRVQRFLLSPPTRSGLWKVRERKPSTQRECPVCQFEKTVFSLSSLTTPRSAWEPGPRAQRHLRGPEAGGRASQAPLSLPGDRPQWLDSCAGEWGSRGHKAGRGWQFRRRDPGDPEL